MGSADTDKFKHLSHGEYYRVIKPGKIRLMLETPPDGPGDVFIEYSDGKKQKKQKMTHVETKASEKAMKAEIDLDTDESCFKYRFSYIRGGEEKFYPEKDWFIGFTGHISGVPSWGRDVVWYQIFPERFRNGNPASNPTLDDIKEPWVRNWRIKDWGGDWYSQDPWEKENFKSVFESIFYRRYGGDLQGIIDKLDYIKNLGIGAIYLNPVFRGPSLHKYDGSTFHHVDETFGPDPEGDRRKLSDAHETDDPATWIWTKADLKLLELVEKAHRMGMKVIIDGVFNHSSRYFFAFEDILKNGKDSPYRDWYCVTGWDAQNEDGFEYEGWYGHHYLPQFRQVDGNFNDGYKKYLYNITRRWMSPDGDTTRGVDGWRLDVAFCIGHGFWKEWRRLVKSINPESYITGEVIEIAPEYLQGDEFDALMNYPFTFNVLDFFANEKKRISPGVFDRQMKELMGAYPEPITNVMQNLMSSHDAPRLRTFIVNPDMDFRNWHQFHYDSKVEKNPEYRIDRGEEIHVKRHRLIALFQMASVGAPMIYYGDELGMTGANDPDCRKPMLWDDITFEDERVHPVAGFTRPVEKNVPDMQLLEYYRKAVRVRNEEPALRRGDYSTVAADDENNIYAFSRELGRDYIIALFNPENREKSVEIKLPTDRRGRYKDLMDGAVYDFSDGVMKISIGATTGILLKRM